MTKQKIIIVLMTIMMFSILKAVYSKETAEAPIEKGSI